MSYLALYRKYRPSTFDDLVGQNDVSNIIKNEILNNKLSHAYLFSGPRGTGKTSTAKIIAKMINCFNLSKDGIPCGKCDSCIRFYNNNDVVEIDAASNNGVDEIRELIDKVNLVPTVGKYKIYIIDEVHMLTTQAFNALLKTLEEPPSHAIFILATTEFYKIPATVVSRCQKFQFLKFTNKEIVERLTKIASLEHILVNDDILHEIARLSDGGLRDAINMLDQLSSFKNGVLSIDDVYKLNGVISYNELSNLLLYIIDCDIPNIISFVESIDNTGKSINKFLDDLISFLKDILVYKNTHKLDDVIEEKKERVLEVSNLLSLDDLYNIIILMNDLYNQIKNSNFSVILLVTFFIKISNDLKQKNTKDNDGLCSTNNKKLVDKKVCDVEISNNNKIKKSNLINENLKKIRINNAFATASKKNKDNFIKKWNDIKENINSIEYNSIIGIVNDIDVLVVGNNNIIFLVKYDSLLERINNYIDDFENLLFKNFNVIYKIVFIVEDEWLYEKDNYIQNKKKGYNYKYINEKLIDDNNINNNDDNDNKDLSDIDKLISLVGDDVISYK